MTREAGTYDKRTAFINIFSSFKTKDCLSLLLFTFIFLNPIPHTTTWKEGFFYLAVLLFFYLVKQGRYTISFKTPLTIPLLMYAFWAGVGLPFAVDFAESFDDYYTHLIRYIIFYFVLVNHFNNLESLKKMAWVIVVSSAGVSIITLYYYYIYLGMDFSSRFGLTFTDLATNVMGFLTVFAMILSFFLFKFYSRCLFTRVILSISFVATFLSSVMTQSRGTVLAVILSILAFSLRLKSTVIVTFLVVIFLILVTPLSEKMTIESLKTDPRVALGLYSFEVMKDYPVTGTGYAFDTPYQDGKVITKEQYLSKIPIELRKVIELNRIDLILPHNMFLSIGARVGILGMVFFFWLLICCFKALFYVFRKGKKPLFKEWAFCIQAGFLAFVVKGTFEPINTHFVEVTYFSLFAMASILWQVNEQDQTKVATATKWTHKS